MAVKRPVLKRAKFSGMQLKQLNYIAAALLILQAVIILVVSSSSSGARPINTEFISEDTLASASAGKPVMAQAAHQLFQLNLAYLVAAFLLVSGIWFLLSSTRFNNFYQRDLKMGKNRLRWFGFAAWSSLVMLAIAILVGVYNISSLLMIIGLSVTAAILWLLKETVRPANWLNYWVGLGASVLPWIIVLIYAWSAHAYGTSLPTYVDWVIISMLLGFAALAVNFGFQSQKIGRWEDYLYGEKMFIVLAVVIQSALAWQLYAGTLR